MRSENFNLSNLVHFSQLPPFGTMSTERSELQEMDGLEGHDAVVMLLVVPDDDVAADAKDKDGWTPLWQAVTF